MKRAVLVIWFLSVLVIGAGAWWYLFTPGSVPDGQRPLGDEAAFRQAFHAGVEKKRIVALLSPTTTADLAVAQYLQALLLERENDALEVHVIWQPVVKGDWAPTTDAMARISDPRVRQYWVNGSAIRAEAGAGQVLIYSRGAGLQSAAVRVADWKSDGARLREFLGMPGRL